MRREQISFNVEVSECAEAEGIKNEQNHPVTPVAPAIGLDGTDSEELWECSTLVRS